MCPGLLASASPPRRTLSPHAFRRAELNAYSADSTPEPTTERKTRLRTPRVSRATPSVVLPPSPAAVADEIETRTNQIMDSAKSAIDSTDIKETALNVRDRMSNVISVNATSLSLEALLLLAAVIPVTYELAIPAIEALGTAATTYTVPDLFVVLTSSFWAPFLTWFATALALPIVNGLLFNFVAVSVSATEEASYQVDPLTFAVTKALIAYLVHYKNFSFGGVLGSSAIATVGDSVGRELQIIGSFIGIIAAIWEATLRR